MLVSVSIPCYGDWKHNFAMDVIRLISCLPENGGVAVEINYVCSTYLHQARQDLAKQALQNKADYLLFLDADMRFPSDSLLRLLKRGKSIIGANYTQRHAPHRPVASKDNKRFSSRGRSGIEEVHTIGFGVCLIATEVFRKMPKPWFMFGYNPRTDDIVGEDVYFFAKAKEAGFPAFVDHDLSQDVRHIGEVELDIDMGAIG